MFNRASTAFLLYLLLYHGCSGAGSGPPPRLQHTAVGGSPEVIALYEAWFGHPRHISVGYSSHDPDVINSQIRRAQSMGISAFVVDWYGDREPFIDRSYALMQEAAGKDHFHVAMMYDETDEEEGATDEAIADFTMFHDTYLASSAAGHQAYLTYEGRPVIFIFPKGGHTDWSKVRAVVEKWNPAPLLIQENLPGQDAGAFDGFYAWINPGPKGWTADGSNWGEQYLADFYQTMKTKYSDKIIVGGAWSQFDDSKASWSLNRHMSARCGQTYSDTFNFWRKEFPPDQPIPFILIETWNDYEEGTAIEHGIPTCGSSPAATPLSSSADASRGAQSKP
jgi:Glycosyl hydrolase family 71